MEEMSERNQALVQRAVKATAERIEKMGQE